MRTLPIGLALAVSLLLAGCASLQDVMNSSAPLDEATVARGLKEALSVGTQRTANQVGALDGYLKNAALKIVLPPQVQDVAGTLRSVGMGQKVDELEVAMNRAAEQAAGESVSVFGDAIRGMTIADAWGILRGGDTAATDYFREKTSTALTGRYRPIIENRLQGVGGYSDYESLVAKLQSLPFVNPPDLDLVGYVTDHALDGLFKVLATEEQKIRDDPVARTTALLQRVFGAQ